ncbi:flavin reductase family protein [Actinoplanes sp. M2I2]|uniref:flavin reductase family protein n=1 Tax=Actinoplanes sp. M2I2 TaxID=1734444 RepID=UPI0020223DBF|nr:flavin reductase family protein [Actinoplanes sp. M2I2]
MSVSADDFRAVMGAVATPVAVVTAMDHGRPHGTTVSAFTSLSLDPPMVLVALDRDSALLSIVTRTRRFGLNVLTAEQSGLALTFARKGDEKFAGVAWAHQHGLPRLDAVSGWLACDVDQLIPGGDHIVAIGRVTAAEHDPRAPLTYHRRTFGTHAVLS